MQTQNGNLIRILGEKKENLYETLLGNRNIHEDNLEAFFHPKIEDLHDPFLMPDMQIAVERILVAREQKERMVIFGDYDVDGVSSTAILVKFLTEIGCLVSYRLPHRVHDGYGLKDYFFDELKEKNVSLVITVDCGTRDIGPIKHAKSIGIDVIVTDHHAVPDNIPEEVIAIVNPKRKDSKYPFQNLAGAGVAFKLLHGILIGMKSNNISETLTRYIDFASLGTVADCMPIIGENRVITTLGLTQMKQSESVGLRNFLEGRDQIEGNADIIGFQIGPRINAAGRMDTPLTALRWLLAGEGRTDEFFAELETLNDTRKGTTESHFQKALEHIDTSKPVIFYDARDLEHGIIGLVAGRLTEIYNKPTIVIKNGHDHPLTSRKGDTISVTENTKSITLSSEETSVASCRSPEWCNLIELLDTCKDFFVRYGGHRQAAGFTIETSQIPAFREAIWREIARVHDISDLPKKELTVECILAPSDIHVDTLADIDHFRPFGIGNPKPLFILENVTISNTKSLGQDEKHLSITIAESPSLRFLMWNVGDKKAHLAPGNIVSFVIEIDRNEWKGNISVQSIIKDIII
ncbi:DHH family phosphoesterase [Candidatus Gracilibacteria bacterium]|nr:DHH family phosphoesterase [Candidatus Gracilibacteria bacterium]